MEVLAEVSQQGEDLGDKGQGPSGRAGGAPEEPNEPVDDRGRVGFSDAFTSSSKDEVSRRRDRGDPTPSGDGGGSGLGGREVVPGEPESGEVMQDGGMDVSPVSPLSTTNEPHGHFDEELQAVATNLTTEEQSFPAQELDDFITDCDTSIDYVKASDPSNPNYRPLTVMELCCEEESIITQRC